jgi:hypothetical protein
VNTRMKQALGMGALVTVALGIGACGPSTHATAPGPTASPSPSPLTAKGALTASVTMLNTTSYNVKVTGDGVTGSGAVNAPTSGAFLNLVMPIGSGTNLKMNTLAVDGKVYLKMDAGIANSGMHLRPKTWLLVDPAKLGKDVSLPLDTADPTDPLDIDGLNQGVTSAVRTDATHITGTIDLTQVGGVAAPDPSDVTKAGAKAKTVPFAATLDAQGRLLTFTINGAKIAKSLQLSIVFSHYGAASAVTAPAAASVSPATASTYALLNG